MTSLDGDRVTSGAVENPGFQLEAVLATESVGLDVDSIGSPALFTSPNEVAGAVAKEPKSIDLMRPFSELFGVPAAAGLRSRDRKPLMVTVLSKPRPELESLVPQVDPRYVFHPEVTRNVVMALEEDLTLYLTGHTGTGKTTLINQVCALTRRPRIRVQHTVNLEESHITGQWTVRNGQTVFQPGPLPFAMAHGLVYVADEFDMALPSVVAVYQAVMEHEPLFVPDAPEEFRILKPHPLFRFCATGNTGGGGDETGLYQGTHIMNAANFSRWEVTDVVNYHDAATETQIIMRQARVPVAAAEGIVQLAAIIRKAFAAGRIAATIGPRELVNAARIGRIKGGDYRTGVRLAFTNRLGSVDRIAVDQMAQRVFG